MNKIQTNEMGIHLSDTSSLQSVMVEPEHHMNANCTACGDKMKFFEGDVIFGEDWYHNKCWQTKHLEVKQNV